MTWPMIRLLDICRPKQWKTISSDLLTQSGYPVYGANGKIGFYTEFTHRLPTLMITCRGATCGSINLSEPFSYISGNAMALDDLDQKRVDQNYLRHCLEYRGFDDAITGAAQPQITRQNLDRVKIPLPPLSEQKRIAAILDKADQLRQKRRQAITLLDSLTQSIFLEMFGDPVISWPSFELKDVVRSGTIVTYGIVQAGDEFDGGVPYIRTGDIRDGRIESSGVRHTDPSLAAKFARSRVEAGEIVMSIRATVGTTAIVPLELDGANLTQGTARISPGEHVTREYLLYYLRSEPAQNWIQRQVKGATFREITLSRLRELTVVVPPIEMQRQFSNLAQKNQKAILDHSHSKKHIDYLFSSLQHRAFSGQL